MSERFQRCYHRHRFVFYVVFTLISDSQDFSLTNDASLVLAQNLTLVGPILKEKAPDKEQVVT